LEGDKKYTSRAILSQTEGIAVASNLAYNRLIKNNYPGFFGPHTHLNFTEKKTKSIDLIKSIDNVFLKQKTNPIPDVDEKNPS
jgi:hypothetical protein